MTTLGLHYRATTGDPWTAVPSLSASFPSLAAGLLPIAMLTIETGPQTETPCGCPDSTTDDSYLILRAECAPIPLSLSQSVLQFLVAFKKASLHEAESSYYNGSSFVPATLSLLSATEVNGALAISFRLAAALTDVIG